MRRVYLKAKEAEKEMQEARESKEFTGKNEKLLIENLVKSAKNNSRIGDKLLMVIDPMEIHIPEWQRRIKLERAYSIGNNYNSYKWDEPKVLLYKGILLCIDGQHRIYGAFKAKKDAVGTFYFRNPDELDLIVKAFEGLFYITFEADLQMRIGSGVVDSLIYEDLNTGCCKICDLCFMRGESINGNWTCKRSLK